MFMIPCMCGVFGTIQWHTHTHINEEGEAKLAARKQPKRVHEVWNEHRCMGVGYKSLEDLNM